MRFLATILCAITLTGCSAVLGVTPQTDNDRLAVAYVAVEKAATAAAIYVENNEISPEARAALGIASGRARAFIDGDYALANCAGDTALDLSLCAHDITGLILEALNDR